MNCPNCNETLVMADRQGVEIDYCPKCRGVWLDKGELDKIIDRSARLQPEYNKPDNYADNRDRDDDQPFSNQPRQPQPYKKKRGFLGDLFDFD